MPQPPPPRMSAPITHDEFRREIDRLDRRLDTFEARTERNFSTFLDAILERMDARFAAQERYYDERFAKMDERFAKVDERFAKMDERFAKMDERFAKMDERFAKMDERFEVLEKRWDARIAELHVDLARHANAIQENVAQQIRVIDDKYKDLPGRVAALEAAQPQPPRKRAR